MTANTIKTTESNEVKALRMYFESQTADREPLADRIQEAQDLIDNGDYMVLTDEEADEKAKDYILESVWAFNYDFLCAHSEAIAEIPKKEYEQMAGKLCESFNKAVLAMIPDKEHFVKDAILADGRGHFLSPYDGQENEIKVGKEYYFIYRQN
jgi:hypothetical protein